MNFWKTCMLSAAGAVLFSAAALRAETRVQGAGASFPAPLYAKWVEAFNKTHPGVVVDYQSSGSGAGIKAITDRTVQFGATDGPMTADQEKNTPAKTMHLPTVAGPEVIIYHLAGVEGLKLNGEVVADIYLKKIRVWNDPKIAALNPGKKLPETPIAVVHRSDGSGTTYIFTDFLSKVSAEWKAKVGKGTAVQWPTGTGGQGNPGVAAAVQNGDGSIGYVEAAYATKQQPPLPFAIQINADGKEVAPSVANVVAAANASIKEFPEDLKVSITNAPGADSYPICGFTYIVVYQDMSYLKDKAQAQALVDFLKWCVTDEDAKKMATDLGYAPLPKEAQSKVLEKLKSVVFDGQPLAK